MRRRTLLQSALALSATRLFAAQRLPIATAVEYSMLPQNASIQERFQIAHDAGFERIECPTTPKEAEAEAMKAAASKAGIRIHSVMNMDHWKYPLSSADPDVVSRSVAGMKTSIRNAKLWKASTVLLVPAVVNPTTSYADAWSRSRTQIERLLPVAE